MYKVNKYKPSCVDSSDVIVETAATADDVLQTVSYREAVGNRYLYWFVDNPFSLQTYMHELTCNMLFFCKDDNGVYWGALHVVTDTLHEMQVFLRVASAQVVTREP